ncbi:cytochrome c biogenesis protein CcsA [Shigella sonnei]
MLRLIISRGNSYRIIYLHVPAAIWSMGIYASMAVAAFTGLVWQMKWPTWRWRRWHPLVPCLPLLPWLLALHGENRCGTWWVSDARLTSELVLLFLYVGVIALWHAFDDRRLAGLRQVSWC